jgi:hypothetical protein
MNLKKPSLKLLLPLVASFFLMAATADAAPTLVPSPDPVAFGIQDIHLPAGQDNITIEFTNTSGAPITSTGSDVITGADAADFHFYADYCSGTTVAEGASCIIIVNFTPSTTGSPEQALLEVGTDAGESTVAMSGTGATGTLAGTSGLFTSIPYYYQNSQQVTFAENSPYIVNPGVATITGADASDFAVSYNGCIYPIYPTSTCMVNVTFQAGAPGTYTAQLELQNDGTTTPVIVPLQATALVGPNLEVSPPRFDFGNVALNTTSPKQKFTITNNGDYVAGISEFLPLGGDPNAFPIAENTCQNKAMFYSQLIPGQSCSFEVSYRPANSALSNLSVYLFTSAMNPTIVPLEGTGVASPSGSVEIKGTPQVTKKLNCSPVGFPAQTSFRYVWKRGAAVIKGATSAGYTLTRADIGKKVSCVLVATNPVGRQQLNAAGVKVGPLDLSELDGSLVNEQISRSTQVGGSLKAAGEPVEVDAGKPVSASDPLVLRSQTKMTVAVDGSVLGKGKIVVLSPRALSRFADGVHVLSVTSDGRTSSAKLILAEASLATQLSGGTRSGSTIVVSSQYQLNSVHFNLPAGLEFNAGEADLGEVQFESAVAPTQSFPLMASVKLVLEKHSIVITNLSTQTGQIRFRLRPGVISGSGGFVTTVVSTPVSAQTTVRTAATW